jgi:hypothetical protein
MSDKGLTEHLVNEHSPNPPWAEESGVIWDQNYLKTFRNNVLMDTHRNFHRHPKDYIEFPLNHKHEGIIK